MRTANPRFPVLSIFAIRNSPFSLLAGLPIWIAATGCSGHALVHTIPLGTQKINTTGPMLLRESLDECCYWVSEKDELCVAMQKFDRSILGKLLEREFIMTFVVPGLPAATSRDYRMDRSTVRLLSRFGISPQRGGSLNGILAVWDFKKGRLRGRFRFNAKQQTYSVLTGWSGNSTVLYVGEFTAVPDRARGEKLLARTEEGVLSRREPAHPASRSMATSPP